VKNVTTARSVPRTPNRLSCLAGVGASISIDFSTAGDTQHHNGHRQQQRE
jgi:hypothetical protein